LIIGLNGLRGIKLRIPEFGKRGQGAFEYILLVAGILLIVVLVILLLKGGLVSQSGANVAESGEKARINSEINCLQFCGAGAWKYITPNAKGNYTNCTVREGITGNPACFWNASTGDTATCNVTAVLIEAGYTPSEAAKYYNVTPANTDFCGYVRQTAKESTR
jgi:hypothetical protein